VNDKKKNIITPSELKFLVPTVNKLGFWKKRQLYSLLLTNLLTNIEILSKVLYIYIKEHVADKAEGSRAP